MKCFKIISNNTNDVVFCELLELLPDGRTVFKRSNEIVFIAPISATIVNQDLEIDFIKGLEYIRQEYSDKRRKTNLKIKENDTNLQSLEVLNARKCVLYDIEYNLEKIIYNLKLKLKCE